MTDTTVAPQGSAPQAAPVTEVPINPNPVSTPNPVGSQAPQDENRLRREAVERAYERAANPTQPSRHAPKEAPKAAEAKAGHNKPPEETEKFDLKKRPPPAREEQPRGDQGRFAPRTDREQPQQQRNAAAQNTLPHFRQLPEGTPFRDPPQRISDHARAAWADTPEPVRGEIHRQQHEFARAYQGYKAVNDAFAPIARFHQMAQQHGTTLDAALTNYVGMEQKLRADPIAGLDQIVYNLDLKTSDGHRINMRDIAYHILSQSPDQLKAMQQGNTQQAANHQIGALHQQVAGLQQHLQRMQVQQHFNYTRSAVDQFAYSHPRFDELGDLIEMELKSGYNLETAYRRAELLRPSTHAAQTRTTPAQTRQDKSIYGSPEAANGSGRERPRQASRSPREAIEKAIARQNGAF